MDDTPPVFSPRKPWVPLLVTLCLLAGLSALVSWQWLVLGANSREEQDARFALAVDGVEQSVRERMLAYEMVLRGMSGLMAGSSDVSHEEWQRAGDQLQLQERYPGIQALSWNRYLRGAELDRYVQFARANGRPEFQAFPPGLRDDYLIVDFINPLDWRNRRALGFDMYTEATRRQAISLARDSGEAVLTGPIKLRQETEQDVQAGLILYMPVYRQNAPQTNTEERQAAVQGMVAGTFRMADLMQGILGSSSELFWVELVDSMDAASPLLKLASAEAKPSRFEVRRTLNIYGRTWQLKVSSTPQYEQAVHNNSLNIKRRGTAPMADLIRVHALAIGSVATNSFERLRDIIAAKVLPNGRGEDLRDAYEMIAMTRIRQQALALQAGETPDNNVVPERLSEFERKHLKEAFSVLSNAQKFAKFHMRA